MVSVIVTTTDIFPPCIDTTTIIHRKRQQARGNDSNYKTNFISILMSLCHFLYKSLIYNMFSGDIM